MSKLVTPLLFLSLGFVSLAAQGNTDAELEEKLKAVMILFDKSQEGLKEDIESLELQLSSLEKENAALKRELESVRRQNLDLKSQLVVQEARGLTPDTPGDGVSSELVAANAAPGAGNPRPERGAGRAGGARFAAPADVPAGDLLNINEATREQLLRLPLVNEFLADNIIAGRPWESIEDLIQLQGFGPMKLRRLQPYILAAPVSEKPEASVSENPVD